jgi:hypothetical protein
MIDLAIDDRVIINDKLDAALQELDLLFNTENTELIGMTNFGVSLDQFLWTLTPTTESFREYINDKLSTLFYLKYFNYNIDVQFLEGEFRSIYHLKIIIYLEDNKTIQKEYEFR